MVQIAHTFLFEFVRRGESDGSREKNLRKRVSGVKTGEGAETSRLSESKADVIVLRPYGFEYGACKSILTRAKIVNFETVFRVGEDSGDAKFGIRSITDGDELIR